MTRYGRLGYLTVLLLAPLVRAQGQETSGPHYVVQVQPLSKLIRTYKVFAGKFATPQLGRKKADEQAAIETEEQLTQMLGKGWRDAIDENRPLLLYGYLHEDPQKSLPIVLIPVKSAEAAREHLWARGAKLEPAGEGTQKATLPDHKDPLYLRFSAGYVYVSNGDAEALGQKKLIAPERLFGDGKEAMVARVHLDRLPADLVDKAQQVVQKGTEQGLQQSLQNMPPPLQKLAQQGQKETDEFTRALLTNGKQLLVRADLDSRNGELRTDLVLTAKEDSKLASLLAAIRPGASLGEALADSSSLGGIHVRICLPEALGSLLVGLLRQTTQQALAQVESDRARASYQALSESLEPTLKEGTIDLSLVFQGPGQKKRYSALLALQMKDGRAVEKAARKVMGSLPAKNPLRLMALDTDTIGEAKVHTYPLGDMVPPMVQTLFGKDPALLAFREEGMVIAFGEEAEASLRKGLSTALRKAPALLLKAEGDAKGLANLMSVLDAGSAAGARGFAELFEDRLRLLFLSVRGGETLHLQAAVNLISLPRTAQTKAGSGPKEIRVKPAIDPSLPPPGKP